MSDKREYTFISLFAGGGGSSLGYRMAGFRELLAIEWDDNAVETLRLNFPGLEVWQRDIRTVKGEEILSALGLQVGELDLLDGSPPCQGFSMTGRRRIDDERNDLVRENIRLIKELQPKVFVIENVKGIIMGKMKILFRQYLQELRQLDYKVKVALLNTKYYGVPQSRERVIFIGIRDDIGIEPCFPEPQKRIINVKRALEGIRERGEVKYPTGKAAIYYDRILPGRDLSSVISRLEGKITYWNIKKVHPLKPSQTIIRVFNTAVAGLLHWSEKRFLTIAELKRLATFPDDYKFVGKFEEQWARIGNSVPPLFMKAIAECIKKRILERYYAQSI